VVRWSAIGLRLGGDTVVHRISGLVQGGRRLAEPVPRGRPGEFPRCRASSLV